MLLQELSLQTYWAFPNVGFLKIVSCIMVKSFQCIIQFTCNENNLGFVVEHVEQFETVKNELQYLKD
jgi:hypothetical protein